MPVVLVHGVPETPAVWEHLRSELHRSDIVTPQLPGFGCPRPDGFGSTKEEYVQGLVSELETLAAQGPIDLVGHDWGGGFVVRVVSTRPDLVRSWVTDAAGIGDVNFEWHDFAKIWQTPGEGEEFFEQQMAIAPEERGSVFEMFGVPPERAVTLASWADPLMAESILALYRSAVDVGHEWGPDFRDIPKPGLVLLPTEDPFLSDVSATNSARRAGASLEKLEGIGHWWMLQDPARGAQALEAFWSTVD
ncbi:MAG TPA: alpha/beta hydrolase [Acidimicrobiales bacterium]